MSDEELFARYFTGDLGDDGAARLKDLLRGDADARRAFVHHLLERGQLIAACAQLRAADGADGTVAGTGQAPAPARAATRRTGRRPARIGRRAGPRPGIPGWAWAACAAAAALAVGIAIHARSGAAAGDAQALVVALSGQVTVTVDGSARALRLHEALPSGALVRTGDGSSARLGWRGEDTVVALGPASEAQVLSAGGKTLVLAVGMLDATVSRQRVGAPLRVRTPEAVVTVVGTRFRVTAGDSGSLVAVTEGTVRVQRQDADPGVLVGAGDSLAVARDRGVPAAAPADPAAAGAPEWSFHLGINIAGQATTVDGRRWIGHEEALRAGLQVEGAGLRMGTAVTTPVPPVDAGLQAVLDSTLWATKAPLRIRLPLPVGEYRVALLVIENIATDQRSIDIHLQGRLAETATAALPLNHWRRYGPYDATVTDGRLDLHLVPLRHSPHLMGLEILRRDAPRPAPP